MSRQNMQHKCHLLLTNRCLENTLQATLPQRRTSGLQDTLYMLPLPPDCIRLGSTRSESFALSMTCQLDTVRKSRPALLRIAQPHTECKKQRLLARSTRLRTPCSWLQFLPHWKSHQRIRVAGSGGHRNSQQGLLRKVGQEFHLHSQHLRCTCQRRTVCARLFCTRARPDKENTQPDHL